MNRIQSEYEDTVYKRRGANSTYIGCNNGCYIGIWNVSLTGFQNVNIIREKISSKKVAIKVDIF